MKSFEISDIMKDLGFEKLTPIQERSIPLLLEGRDLIGQSKTGSGKTAAFALPILKNLEEIPYLQALILCPTRELSAQVARELRRLGRSGGGLQVAVLCGGQSSREQVASLENGAHIAVGTPGRIADLIERGRLDLNSLRTLVMDEADKMLEMGFEKEIDFIMQQVPEKRQTVFFSATFPEGIKSLSQQFQKDPAHIVIEEEKNEASLIEQFVYDYGKDDKFQTLIRIVQQHASPSTLIFCNQKITVDDLVEKIASQDVSCAALHGDLEQRDRDKVMALFRNGSLRILVATDVAARGLDIKDLDLVINYDLPITPDVYVHRIGRTGRAERKGQAVTLAAIHESAKIFEFEKIAGVKFLRPSLGFKNQFGLGGNFKETAMQTVSIFGGRKDKLRPGDILGALTGDAGDLKGGDIGKIEIHDRVSYVAVSSLVAEKAIRRLRLGKIKGQKFQVKLLS